MKFSRKQLALIALVIVLVVSNIAFAVLYMTRDVTITGGVSVVGSIEVYKDDGVTLLTSIDFENFTGGDSGARLQDFFINNTGNQPVYVYWNISTSSLVGWVPTATDYYYQEESTTKYTFSIRNATLDYWTADTEARMIDVGQAISEQFVLGYSGDVNTAETFSLTVTFYAKDA